MTNPHPTQINHFGSLTIFQRGQIRYETSVTGEFILGRQRSTDPGPFAKLDSPTATRLIVAPRTDQLVSREHLRILPRVGGGFDLTNASSNCTVNIDPGRELLPGKHRIIEGTTRIRVGDLTITLEPASSTDQLISLGTPNDFLNADVPSLSTLPNDEDPSPNQQNYHQSLVATLGSSFDGQQHDYLLLWLRTIACLFRHAHEPDRFRQEAAQVISRMIGADYVIALSALPVEVGSDTDERSVKPSPPNHSPTITPPEGWRVEATNELTPNTLQPPSGRVLNQMQESQQTILFRQLPKATAAEPMVLELQALATPCFNSSGEIIGAFYAARVTSNADQENHDNVPAVPTLGPLEASLVELIASGLRGT